MGRWNCISNISIQFHKKVYEKGEEMQVASQESMFVRQMLKEQSAAQAAANLTIEEFRKQFEASKQGVQLDPDITVEKLTVDGIPAEWVYAPNAAEGRTFLYLHGGAYFLGSCNTHRDLAALMARATASRVLLIEYRLAPEHPYPAALEDAVAAYRWLVRSGYDPANMIIGGDSAGGGLTLGTLITLRDSGERLPACAVLLSPWTDLAGTGESLKTRRDADPWLNPDELIPTARMYLRDLDPRHPVVSPIYADLQGLPPMIVHVGTDEILLDDSLRLAERARNAGVETELKVWDEMWHVFQSFPIPEARQSIEEIGAFVAGVLNRNRSSA
jgi:acetyl esterase/lipase